MNAYLYNTDSGSLRQPMLLAVASSCVRASEQRHGIEQVAELASEAEAAPVI